MTQPHRRRCSPLLVLMAWHLSWSIASSPTPVDAAIRWKNITRDHQIAMYDDDDDDELIQDGHNNHRRQLIPDARATKTIYGIFVDSYIYLPEDENRDVYQECFKGMELQSCQHCGGTMTRESDGKFNCTYESTLLRDNDARGRVQNPFGDSIYGMAGGGDDEGWEIPPDSQDIDYPRSQQPFCLYCCSQNDPQPGYETNLVWDLFCPIDGLDRPRGLLPYTDFNNYQFRFARKQSFVDTEVVTCDLLRTEDQRNMVLQGYDLTIYIVDYYKDGDYWRGVDSCEAKFIFDPVWNENSCRDTFNEETFLAECKCLGDPCVFREKITMVRARSMSGTNFFLVITIWAMVFCCCLCGVLSYYTGRCGQWCDYTDGVNWCTGIG